MKCLGHRGFESRTIRKEQGRAQANGPANRKCIERPSRDEGNEFAHRSGGGSKVAPRPGTTSGNGGRWRWKQSDEAVKLRGKRSGAGTAAELRTLMRPISSGYRVFQAIINAEECFS